MDRQVYYRDIQRDKNKQSTSAIVVDLVKEIRAIMPRLGGKKLYCILQNSLQKLKIGRDKLFTILKANNMLIIPRKKYQKTTNSHHRFKKHKNLIKNTECERVNQIWVSDITYTGNRENPSYLALITDVYSKKIVGFNVSDSLSVDGSVKALEMALSNRNTKKKFPLIHHSDRGLQYCSNEYQKLLKENNIEPSMTEQYDPYENAVAERVNGILKQEFDIDKHNTSLELKTKLISNAIQIYNEKRPHWSNSLLTPNQMYEQTQIKPKTYKKTKGSNIKITTFEVL
jgi:transposase InsO family protein